MTDQQPTTWTPERLREMHQAAAGNYTMRVGADPCRAELANGPSDDRRGFVAQFRSASGAAAYVAMHNSLGDLLAEIERQKERADAAERYSQGLVKDIERLRAELAQRDAEHPMQPLVRDEHGVVRFKRNAIVAHLLDHGGIDMNAIARLPFDDLDREQFAQLIGYSVDGFGELGYARPETVAAADRMAIEAKQAAKVEVWNTVEHGKPAEAAQQGPSDEEIVASINGTRAFGCPHAAHALRLLARRAGVKGVKV